MLNREEVADFIKRASKADRTKTWKLAEQLDEAVTIIREQREAIEAINALAHGKQPYETR